MTDVSFDRDGDVAVLTIDSPPVNALSQPVRAAMLKAFEEVAADPATKAVVLIGGGKTFIAGADIREFGKPPQPPSLRELHDLMDACPKPVVAALHGSVLGGGLETALACHYRIAAPGTKFGLPEVTLGILPGAGGTQRLPRIIGPAAALEMILSGKPIGTETALADGIIDRITEGDLLRDAVEFARHIASRPFKRVRDRTEKIADTAVVIFAEARKRLEKSARGLIAPFKVVDCVQAACTLPFDEGLAKEREALAECMNSPQRAAQVHLFFASRNANKIPLLAGVKPTPIYTASVIGAGTMGGGIAMCFANAGVPVRIVDTSEEAIGRGRAVIDKNYQASIKRGSLSPKDYAKALSLISYHTDLVSARDGDIVIEAVFEDLSVKRDLMTRLDAAMKPGAILATNTSTLDIDTLAEATNRPEAVIGTHFFSPANVMRLLEVVRGAKSSLETIATAMELGKLLGKTTVLAGNCDGFIANRMQAPFGNEIDRLIEQGASPQQVDRVLQEFGFAMGPLAVRDLVGIDTGWRIRDQRRKLRPGSQPPTPLMDRLYAAGRLGQKTGRGYYRYEERRALPDPDVDRIIDEIAHDLGVTRTPVDDQEIRRRTLFALVNEAAKILDEGIALRSSDIDLAYVNGYGFPAWRGGPMFWAQSLGLREVYAQISELHSRYGRPWEPSPLLRRSAEIGKWP